MIKNLELDYSLKNNQDFDAESTLNNSGALLQGLKCATIKTNSAVYVTGYSFDVIAGWVFRDTFPVIATIRGKEYRFQDIRVRCKIADNQEIMSKVGSMYGGRVLFHSKPFTGVVQTICVTGDIYIDIIVKALTTECTAHTLRLSNENIRFTLINDEQSKYTFSELTVSLVKENAKEATYGDSRLVYNREIDYEITLAQRKVRVEEIGGEYTNSNFAFIELFHEASFNLPGIRLNNVNSSYVTDEDSTFVVNDFKTTRNFFIFNPESKVMNYKGNACYLNFQVPLI